MLRTSLTLLLLCYAANAASALLESRAEGKVEITGRGEIRLFDFRPDSIAGWKISKATLFLHLESGEAPARLAVSGIAVRWTEDQPGLAKAAIFGKGKSMHGEYPATVLQQGWITVDLPPALLEMHGAEKSFGFAIEQGKRKLSGRRPVSGQPYILVEGRTPRQLTGRGKGEARLLKGDVTCTC